MDTTTTDRDLDHADMKRRLANLPDLERKVVLMAKADGLSVDEIAGVTGMSVPAVQTTFIAALSRLGWGGMARAA